MTVAYLPAEQRVEIIRAYAHRYRIKTFIETGTSAGETTAALMDDMDKVYTIELSGELYLAAEQRFASCPNVTCLHGDSAQVLPTLLGRVTEPVIFWLDGHYCGDPHGRGDIDTPVVTELEYAVCFPRGSVILIDDARLFGGMPEHTEEFKDYPDVAWIQNVASEEGLSFLLEDDIMRLTPDVY